MGLPLRTREVAGGPVTRRVLDELRVDLGADLLRLPAPRVEAAAGRRVHRGRHVAGKNDPLALALDGRIGDRHGRKERLRIRVKRVLVEVDAVAELDDLAEVHDRDAVADVANDRQVVSDEEVRELELVLQLLEEVDDLRLDGDVEGRDRLVGDDELRLDREGAGDADALPLTTGELVRIAVREVWVETDDLQELLHALGLRLAAREVMHLERLADDVADGHAWVQRRVRVLEDHLHPAAHLPHRLAAELREFDAVELHFAGRRLVELEDRAAGRRLPATRLADEAEGLALLDEEVDAVDGAHRADLALEDDPLRQREVHLERLHVEQVLAAVERRRRAAALDELIGLHGHVALPMGSAGAAPPLRCASLRAARRPSLP